MTLRSELSGIVKKLLKEYSEKEGKTGRTLSLEGVGKRPILVGLKKQKYQFFHTFREVERDFGF